MKGENTNKWLIAISVFTGSVMSTIDAFILFIATPHLRGVFSTTVAEISWVSTIYSVAAVIFMLLSGYLCEHFGKKRTYQTGLLIFIISSILCGLSSSLTFLIIARIFQGIGAGIIVPVENVILRSTFPPREHGIVLGIYGTTVMVGPSLGPVLGGIIIDNIHWSFLFYVNVPIGIIGFILVQRYLPVDIATKKFTESKIDWLGIIYLVVGIFCLIWLLERGDRLYWFETFSNTMLLFVAISTLSLFCAHELMVEKPIVDLRVLNNKIFSTAVTINFLLGFVVTATLFILPIYMQEVLKFTPTKAGETLAPRALVMMIVFPIVGYLFNKVNSKLLIYSGLVIGIISAILMSNFTHETGWRDMLFPQILQGIAVVLVLIPVTTIGLKSVKPEQLPAATAFDSVSRQMGAIMGIAVFASLITHYQQSAWGILRHNVSLSFSVFYKRFEGLMDFFILDKGSSSHIALQQSLMLLYRNVEKQASVITYMNLFQIISVIFVFMLVFSFMVKLNKN